jgi:hypothetical protein
MKGDFASGVTDPEQALGDGDLNCKSMDLIGQTWLIGGGLSD